MLVGLFTGMVLGLQLYYVLIKFGSAGVLGTAVALALIRELGPVLTAIMITARAGSAMTAEIGIQRISEQIDALSTMRIDPLGYLISPRIAAAVISFPILTAFFDLIGILGGWISGCILLGVNSGDYFFRVISSTQMEDIRSGFIKSIVFGVLVVTICCFQGFYTHAHRQLRRQKRQPVDHLGGGAVLRNDPGFRLCCNLIYFVRVLWNNNHSLNLKMSPNPSAAGPFSTGLILKFTRVMSPPSSD